MDLWYLFAISVLLFLVYFTTVYLWKVRNCNGEDMLAIAVIGSIGILWPIALPILIIALLAYGLVVLIVKVKNLARRLKNG